jgi:phospholipid-binding lipoprotein MlaA
MRMFHFFLVCVCLLGALSAHAGALETRADSAQGLIAANQTTSTTTDADFDAAFGEVSGLSQVPEKLINDPFEPINRGVFWINDKLYFYLLKPVARGYRQVVPRPARVSVGNFFTNLAAPIRASNALLQMKFRDFGTEVYRFVINTTFGLGGLFDPAKSVAGVEPAHEDFGQTLGYYGTGHGFYLVLPVVGPSSLRDATGSFVDSFADPLRYADLETPEFVAIRLFAATNRLSLDRDTYEGIVRDAIDPYLFIRGAYAQRRLAQVGQNTYNVYLFEGPLFDSDMLNPSEWLGN